MSAQVVVHMPAVELPKSRLKALLQHFGEIKDPREPWRVAYRLDEILFLVVCGTICDCDDYETITAWGEERLDFLRRYLPYDHGVPGERWLTIMMNRVDPALFQEAFTAWVRETWPDRPDLVAIDGKTSRRSHDRKAGKAPLHLVSAFATTNRLVLAQEAVAEKSAEVVAIPALVERLAEAGALEGALVTIDAKADYLLAVKANQPTLRADVERFFADAPPQSLDIHSEADKGHGRIEERSVTVAHEVDWLCGDRRFPGEFRLPKIACLIRVASRAELRDRSRFETRYYVSSRQLSAKEAHDAVRGHWTVENSLHWTLDVVFHDDQSRLRKGHGAVNMAVVRHFALNLVRTLDDKKPIKRRRKIAGWSTEYLARILAPLSR